MNDDSCAPCGIDICGPAPSCPPVIAASIGSTSPFGESLTISLDDVTCDYGDQIPQLAKTACPEEAPECSLGESIVAQANAEILAALGQCYVLPFVVEATGAPLFPSSLTVPSGLVAGSLPYIVYWQYRRWVGVVTRWYLWRDGRAMEERKPAVMIMYEQQAEKLKDKLNGCASCGCTLLPGLRRVGRAGSVIAVAGRPVSPLQSPQEQMLREAARTRRNRMRDFGAY